MKKFIQFQNTVIKRSLIVLGALLLISLTATLFYSESIKIFLGLLLGGGCGIVVLLIKCYNLKQFAQSAPAKAKHMIIGNLFVSLAIYAAGLAIGFNFAIFNNIATVIGVFIPTTMLFVSGIASKNDAKRS